MKQRLVVVVTLACGLAGCYREQRSFEMPAAASAAAAAAPSSVRAGSLRPGLADPVQPGHEPAAIAPNDEYNAFAVNRGKQLFRWFNCNGCHAQGGGSMGPPLMDDKWLYGSAPADIFATIVQGRPNGMPSFGGRIPDDQVWQLVAYVRSMSGQLRKDVAPSRADGLAGAPPENEREPAPPRPDNEAAARPRTE